MPRGVATSPDLRLKVIECFKKGESYSNISERLMLPKSTVQSLINHYKKNGTIDQKRRMGSKPMTSPAENRMLGRIIRSNRRCSTAVLKEKWELSIGKSMSTQTCRRKIKSLGYGFYKVIYR